MRFRILPAVMLMAASSAASAAPPPTVLQQLGVGGSGGMLTPLLAPLYGAANLGLPALIGLSNSALPGLLVVPVGVLPLPALPLPATQMLQGLGNIGH